VELKALTILADAPPPHEYHWDDAPPAELVQAIGALLELDASATKRQAARARARAAVTTFIRRHRAQGAPPARSLAVVRAAFRHAHAAAQAAGRALKVDHLSVSGRNLREEVVRWAIRADAPLGHQTGLSSLSPIEASPSL
jgi:hypothetical protein